MSSQFDSEVTARRKGNDFLKPDVWFMLKNIVAERDGEATITVASRPSVSSRLWWTIRWPGDDGRPLTVSSERLELAAWRVIVVEERDARKRESGSPSDIDQAE